MIKTLHKLLLLPVVAVLFSACVKEKLVVCYGGLLLRYNYTLNPEDVNRFGEDVDALNILVFESGGLFHEAFVVDEPGRLGNDNLIHLPLPDGKWDIVTWGGDLSSYALGVVNERGETIVHENGHSKGETHIDAHRLWVSDYESDPNGTKFVTNQLKKLYHATITGIETDTTVNQLVVQEVPMIQNTNVLRVIVNGLPPRSTRAGSDYNHDFTLTANMVNGRCKADNFICSDARPVKYMQTYGTATDSGSKQYELTVMRIFSDDSASQLTFTGPLLEENGYPGGIEIPIVPTIMESPDFNTQTDLDRENVYTFIINLDLEGNFSITINGWKIVNVIPEI